MKKKYQGYLLDPTAMMRLRSACERAKIRLCLSPEVDIQIDSLFEGVEFHTTITADRFEELNLELLKKCTRIVEDILEKEKLKKKQIHEVILTGGGANMKVQEILQNFFNGKDLNQSIPPEEVIAHGAAIMAAVLVKRDKQMQELLDVEPEEYNTFELTPEQVDAMVKEAEMYKEVASSMDVDDLD
uniref:Uncharacterized protein n=1 Tax=Arcella intermedia TaxID=1963864 RepID=A0A6B2LL67_9EUKA